MAPTVSCRIGKRRLRLPLDNQGLYYFILRQFMVYCTSLQCLLQAPEHHCMKMLRLHAQIRLFSSPMGTYTICVRWGPPPCYASFLSQLWTPDLSLWQGNSLGYAQSIYSSRISSCHAVMLLEICCVSDKARNKAIIHEKYINIIPNNVQTWSIVLGKSAHWSTNCFIVVTELELAILLFQK